MIPSADVSMTGLSLNATGYSGFASVRESRNCTRPSGLAHVDVLSVSRCGANAEASGGESKPPPSKSGCRGSHAATVSEKHQPSPCDLESLAPDRRGNSLAPPGSSRYKCLLIKQGRRPGLLLLHRDAGHRQRLR